MLDIHNNSVLFIFGKQIKARCHAANRWLKRFFGFDVVDLEGNSQQILDKTKAVKITGSQKAFLKITP